jgi:alkanesulfonate monooxygenase SsuD/methylene tetrahydromethanopterin reductase-like flavin-dependent oxidoreductase (luciferase family)
MSFGISLQTSPSLAGLGDGDALSFVVGRAREAEAAGVDDIWLNQGLDIDGITFAALLAREIPRVVVGIAVVPMYHHHPVSIAGLAKAAQLAARGRFALGIGLGHKAVVENVFGLSYDRPIGHLRDYLRAVRDLLDTGSTASGSVPRPSPPTRNGSAPGGSSASSPATPAAAGVCITAEAGDRVSGDRARRLTLVA